MQEVLNVSDKEMIKSATSILNMAKNFDKIYPNYNNLQKFHSFTFNEKKKEWDNYEY